MPAFVLTAFGLLKPVGSFLKWAWPYLLAIWVVIGAGCLVHRAGVRAATREAQLEKAADDAERALKAAEAEKQRQIIARQIAEATVVGRKEAQVDAGVTQAREQLERDEQDRDLTAISSAKRDDLVAEGGPLERLFSSEEK